MFLLLRNFFLIEINPIFIKNKVLQNEKQTSWGHQFTSGSRPHRAQANQLQPNETNSKTITTKTFDTIKTSQRKDILTTDLSYTNLNIKTTPSDNSLHLKVFSLLTKVPQLSFHFSYFVFQERSILILQHNSLFL